MAAAERAELIGRFRAQLAERQGSVHEADSLDAARCIAAELIGGATVARWSDETLEGIVGPGQEAAPAEAEVSLMLADAGVADTGAFALRHGAGRPRAAGILPSRQVVLLDAADVVADFASALDGLGFRDGAAGSSGAGGAPCNVVFVAGPSRTSDIEQRSILGVHAPREVAVVIFHR